MPLDHVLDAVRQRLSDEHEELHVTPDEQDIISMDVPLFIRLLEVARENVEDDQGLHELATSVIEQSKVGSGILTMKNYRAILRLPEQTPEEELETSLRAS